MKKAKWGLLFSLVMVVIVAVGVQACSSSNASAGNVTIKGAGR